MLIDKLVDLSILFFKRPKAKSLYFSGFDLVDCQEFLVVLFVAFEEACFADKSSWVITVSIYAYIKNVFSLMTLY